VQRLQAHLELDERKLAAFFEQAERSASQIREVIGMR